MRKPLRYGLAVIIAMTTSVVSAPELMAENNLPHNILKDDKLAGIVTD